MLSSSIYVSWETFSINSRNTSSNLLALFRYLDLKYFIWSSLYGALTVQPLSEIKDGFSAIRGLHRRIHFDYIRLCHSQMGLIPDRQLMAEIYERTQNV